VRLRAWKKYPTGRADAAPVPLPDLRASITAKLDDDPLARMTADRALQAAQAGNDPLTPADARRAVATAMRRTGLPDRACDLLIRACRDIEPRGQPDPELHRRQRWEPLRCRGMHR
jgi:hypothetical protein